MQAPSKFSENVAIQFSERSFLIVNIGANSRCAETPNLDSNDHVLVPKASWVVDPWGTRLPRSISVNSLTACSDP